MDRGRCRRLRFAALGATALCLPAVTAHAGDTGLWFGTLERFDAAPMQVQLHVEPQDGAAPKATLEVDGVKLPLGDFQNTTTSVSFSFRPGDTDLVCSLAPDPDDEKRYGGGCRPQASPKAPETLRIHLRRASGGPAPSGSGEGEAAPDPSEAPETAGAGAGGS